MDSRAPVIMLASAIVVLGTCASGRSAPPRLVVTTGMQDAIRVARVAGDSPLSISIDNSRVVVTSHAIDEVVRIGPRVVPILIAMMERKDLEFDHFCKYYSTCEQIFSAKSPGMTTVWYGGAVTEWVPGKGFRIVPRRYVDNAKLRKDVVASIKSNYWFVTKSKD